MSNSNIIQNLIREGVLAYYFDPRSGCFCDYSGNGNIGSPNTHPRFNKGGIFVNNTGKITVPHSTSLDSDNYTLVVLRDLERDTGTPQRLLCKRRTSGAPSTKFDWQVYSTGNQIFDGTGTRALSVSPAGVRYLGANVINGAAGEGFYDGVSVGSYSSAFVIGPDDSPLIVGNQEAANRHLQSLLQAALIIKRPLTAPEHLELYNYLINLRWPNVNSIGYLGDKKSWKTEWGIFESINPKTSGYLENSEFKINSGTFKISRDNVFEKDTKVIDPLAMSLVSLPIGNTRQTNTQAAYGAWQFICAKADPGEINIQFISDNEGISAGGYKIKIDSGENITLERSGVGVLISATATPVPGQYHKYEVTRSASGEFELFFDGVSQGTATDNIIKESAFMVFGLTASCRVCLSAVDGTNCILKEVL